MNERIESEDMILAFIEEPSDDDDDNDNDDNYRFDDSFVGGKPVWLRGDCVPDKLPRCQKCERVQVLLLQLYAPLPDEHSYHRILYIFACTNGACRQYTAWRCQMSKERFESVEKSDEKSVEVATLCSLCGHRAQSVCAKCKSSHYCCREHQRAHWPVHRAQCCGVEKSVENETTSSASSSSTASAASVSPDVLVKRELFELRRIETERERDAFATARKFESEQAHELVARAKVQLDKEGPLPLTKGDETEFASDRSKHIDNAFLEFQHRIETVAPDQIVRYGSAPLSATDSPSLDACKPPPCPRCQSPRRFEAQLLPQLLYFLAVDRSHPSPIDFHSLFVYTCSTSCNAASYLDEYIFQQ
jgi:pre-rRNA-processing protein TSR4